MKKIELTSREKEVLQYSTRGLTVANMAESMFTSADTIKFHKRKLFTKLGVSNIAEAITYATSNKLI